MCYRCRVHDSTSSFRSGFAIHWLPRAVNKSSFITNLSPLSLSHCARGLTLYEVANVSIRPTVPVRSSMHFTLSQFPFSPVPQRDRAHNVRSFLIISSDAGAINRIPQFFSPFYDYVRGVLDNLCHLLLHIHTPSVPDRDWGAQRGSSSLPRFCFCTSFFFPRFVCLTPPFCSTKTSLPAGAC